MTENRESKGQRPKAWMIILTILAVYGLTLLIKSLFSMSAQTYDTMLRIIGAVCFVVCILMLLYQIIREKRKFSRSELVQRILVLLLLLTMIILY